MHFTSLFVGLLAVGAAWGAPPAITLSGVKDFLAVIPTEKVVHVALEYLAYDNEVKEFIDFTRTDDFKNLLREIVALPEYIEFLNLLEEAGFEAYLHVNAFHSLVGLPPLANPVHPSPPALTGGVAGLITDVRALVDKAEIEKVYEEHLKSNPKFNELVEQFKGPQFKSVMEKLLALPDFNKLVAKLNFFPKDEDDQ